MSVHAISWVLRHSTTKGADRLVLIVLADRANDNGECWPGYETVAKEARVSVGAAKRCVRSLVATGVISRQVNAAPDERIPPDRRPNLYVLTAWLDHDRGVRFVPPADKRGSQSVADGARDSSRTGGTDRAPKPSEEPSEEPSVTNLCRTSKREPVPEAETLANLLADLISDEDIPRPNVTQTWVTEIDRMIRLDAVPPERIEGAIRWATGHPFWSANILSPKKLRQHYPRLVKQARQERGKSPNAAVDIIAADLAKMKAAKGEQ